ncbi:MAG: carboxypeptidase regulatory-like domain-containing protein [Clostridia bacterium]|nr:carboxypeptidase regulatory-like domain-containing protein [Clostridia bacterium]
MKKSKIIATLAATAVLSLGGAFALTGCGHEHTYAEEWTQTETHHYYAATCEHADEKKDYGEHVYDNEADAECNTCGYARTITFLTGTITAPGPNGGYKLAGATVSIGGKTATTDENGVYTVYGLTAGSNVEISITHPACNNFTGVVEIATGSNAKNQQLAVKPIAELGQSYFQLKTMEASTATDFTHVKDTGNGWQTRGNVQVDHGEGICLHIDNNQTKEDMESVIYQKIKVTSANSKMMFRVRGFDDNLTKSALFAVRVIDIDGYTKTDLTPKNGTDAWQVIDSASYFTAYEYDLSAYEGKDVVIIIGSKQGQHTVIERIKFIGANESYLMPYTTAADLKGLEASEATNLDGATAVKNAIKDQSWIKVGDQGEADQGWLFKDGPAAADGSTDLCVFTYKKLTFNGTNSIAVHARTFVDQTIPGKTNVPAQIVIKIIDSNGNPVEVGGNCYTIDTDSYQTGYFSLGETLNGDYTFVIGIARGHRLAVDQILFDSVEMVGGNVAGTVKCGTVSVEGAKVTVGGFRTTTRADGSFDLPVEIYPGNSLTVKVEKEGYIYTGAQLSVSDTDFENGEYSLGDITLDKVIIGNITLSKIEALTAAAAADIEIPHNENGTCALQDASWIKDNSSAGGNHISNEGWLFRNEDRYTEDGSTDLNGYAYKKLTFSGVNTIVVRARTFVTQNNVSGHGSVYPQIVIAVIDSEGNLLKIGNNCYTIDTDDYQTAYMTLPQALTGDYTFVIGIARGRVLAVDQIQFKTEAMVKGNVTGTVTDGTKAIEGATVTYAHTSVTTAADGTFTLPVAIFPGNSVTVKVEKAGYTYTGSAINVASTDLASGEKALGDIVLVKEIVKGLTLSMISGLTAVTPENITNAENNNSGSNDAYASWGKVGDQSSSNEGWLLKDAGNAEPEGSTNLQVYTYKKFAFAGLTQITITSRTYGGQNNGITPQLVIVVIDKDGNIVDEFCENVTNNDNYDNGTHTFTLNAALTGDYTLAIGFARGYRLCLGNITFVSES